MAIATGFLYARDRPAWTVGLLAIGVANSPALLLPAGLASLLLIRQALAALVGTIAAALLTGRW